MCTTIVMPDGRWIQSVGEVKAQGWSVEGLIDVNPDEDDQCLCNTDVAAVLQRADLAYNDDGSGFLDVVGPLRVGP